MKQLRWIPVLAAGLAPMVACGPTIGVGNTTGTGGTTAAGGTVVGAGGTIGAGGFVSAGGTVVGAGGTVVSAGGTVVSAGGTVVGAGGTVVAAGGSTSATIECTGTAFAPVNGGFDTGTFCGYGFTYAFADGGTVVPDGSMEDLPEGLCVDGEVPPQDDTEGVYPGIAIGVSLKETPAGKGTYTAAGSGITVKYAKGGGTKFQANIVAEDGTEYCAPLGGTGSDTLTWSDFTEACWTGTGTALKVGVELEQFHLQIQASTAAQTITQACLTGLSEG